MGKVRSVSGEKTKGRARLGQKKAAGVNLRNVHRTRSQQAEKLKCDATKKKVSKVNKATVSQKKISSVQNSADQNSRISRTSNNGPNICTDAALKAKCANKTKQKVTGRGHGTHDHGHCCGCETLVPATSSGLQPRVILHDVGTNTDTLELHIAGNLQRVKPMPFRKKVKCLLGIRSAMTNGNCTAEDEVADIRCVDEVKLADVSPEKACASRKKLVRKRELVSEPNLLSVSLIPESSLGLKVEDAPTPVSCSTEQPESEELRQDKKIKLDCELQEASVLDGRASPDESFNEDSAEDVIAGLHDKAKLSAFLQDVLPQTLYKACRRVCKGTEETVVSAGGSSTVVNVQKRATSNTEESVHLNVVDGEQHPAMKDGPLDVDTHVDKRGEIVLMHSCKKPQQFSLGGLQKANCQSSEQTVCRPRRSSRVARRTSSSCCENSSLRGSQVSVQVTALEETSPSKRNTPKKISVGRLTHRKDSENQGQPLSLVECNDNVNVTSPDSMPEILKGSGSSLEVTHNITSCREIRSNKKVVGTTVSQASQQNDVLDANMKTCITSEEKVEQVNAQHKSSKVTSKMKKHHLRKSVILEKNDLVCIKNERTLRIAVSNKANNSVVGESAENSSCSVSCQQESFSNNAMHETKKRKLISASDELETASDSSNRNLNTTLIRDSENDKCIVSPSEEGIVVETNRCYNENIGHLGVPLSSPKSETSVSVTTGSVVNSVNLSSPAKQNNSLHTNLFCGEKKDARSLASKNSSKGNSVAAKRKDSNPPSGTVNKIKISSLVGDEVLKPDVLKNVRSVKQHTSSSHVNISCVVSNAELTVDAPSHLKNPLSAEQDGGVQSRGKSGVNSVSTTVVQNSKCSRVLHNSSKKKSALMPSTKSTTGESERSSVSNVPNKSNMDSVQLSRSDVETTVNKPHISLKRKKVVAVKRNVTGSKVTPQNEPCYSVKQSRLDTVKSNVRGKDLYTSQILEEPLNLSGDVAVACDSSISISSPRYANGNQVCSETVDNPSMLGVSPKRQCELGDKLSGSGSTNHSPKQTKLLRRSSDVVPANDSHLTSGSVTSNIFPDSDCYHSEGSLVDVATKFGSDIAPPGSRKNVTESNNWNGAGKSKGLPVQDCSSPSTSPRNIQEASPSTNLSSLEMLQKASESSFAFKKPAIAFPVQLRQSPSAASKPEIRNPSVAPQRSGIHSGARSSVEKTAQQTSPKLPRASGVPNSAPVISALNGVGRVQNHVDAEVDDDYDDAISLFACSDIFGTEFGGQECKMTRVGVTKAPAFFKDSDDESEEENDTGIKSKPLEFHQDDEEAGSKNNLAPATTISGNTVVPESTLRSKDNVPSSDKGRDRRVTPPATPRNCDNDNTSVAKPIIFPVQPNIPPHDPVVVADTELGQEAKSQPGTDSIEGPTRFSWVGKMCPKSQTTPKGPFIGIPAQENVGLKNWSSSSKLDAENKTKASFTGSPIQEKLPLNNASEGSFTRTPVQSKLDVENKTKGPFTGKVGFKNLSEGSNTEIPIKRNMGPSNPLGMPTHMPVQSMTEGPLIGTPDQRTVGIKSPSEGSYSGLPAQSRFCPKSQMKRQFPAQGNVGLTGTSHELCTNISVSPEYHTVGSFEAMQRKMNSKCLSEGSHTGIPQVNLGPKMHIPDFADSNAFKREYCTHFMTTGNCTFHHCSDVHVVPEFSVSQKGDLKKMLIKSYHKSFHYAFDEMLAQFLMKVEMESKEHDQSTGMYRELEWVVGTLKECGMRSNSALNEVLRVLCKKKDHVISSLFKRCIIELAACEEVLFETWPAVKLITNDYSDFVCSLWILEKHISACIMNNCVDVAFCKTVLKLFQMVKTQEGHYIEKVKPDLLQKFCSVLESFGLGDEIRNVIGDLQANMPVYKAPEKPACKTVNVTTSPQMTTAYPKILGPDNSKGIPKCKSDFQPTHPSTVASPPTMSPPMTNRRSGVIDLRTVVETRKRQQMQLSVSTESNYSNIQHLSSDSLGDRSIYECTNVPQVSPVKNNKEGSPAVNNCAANVEAGKVGFLPKQCSAAGATHPSQPASGRKPFRPRLVRRNWSCGDNSVGNVDVGETSCSSNVTRRLSLQKQTSSLPSWQPLLLPIPPRPEIQPPVFNERLRCPAALNPPMNQQPGMLLHAQKVEQKLRSDLDVVRRCLINGDYATVAWIIEERRATPQSSAIAREAFEVLKDEVSKMTNHFQNIVNAAVNKCDDGQMRECLAMIGVSSMLHLCARSQWDRAMTVLNTMYKEKIDPHIMIENEGVLFSPARCVLGCCEVYMNNGHCVRAAKLMTDFRLLDPDPSRWLIRHSSGDEDIRNLLAKHVFEGLLDEKITAALNFFQRVYSCQRNDLYPINVRSGFNNLLVGLLNAERKVKALSLYKQLTPATTRVDDTTLRALLCVAVDCGDVQFAITLWKFLRLRGTYFLSLGNVNNFVGVKSFWLKEEMYITLLNHFNQLVAKYTRETIHFADIEEFIVYLVIQNESVTYGSNTPKILEGNTLRTFAVDRVKNILRYSFQPPISVVQGPAEQARQADIDQRTVLTLDPQEVKEHLVSMLSRGSCSLSDCKTASA